MLLSVFILIQIVVILFFLLGFFFKNPILWGVSALFSGFLSVAAWVVEKDYYIWDAAINAYELTTKYYSFSAIAWINIGLFFLTIILFFYDIFQQNTTVSSQPTNS